MPDILTPRTPKHSKESQKEVASTSRQLRGLCAALSSLPAVARQVEGADSRRIVRALQHLRMAQRAHAIAVACAPVLFHGPPGELEVLGGALVALRVVDHLDDVEHVLVGLPREQLRVRLVLQLFGKLVQELYERPAQRLRLP